MLGGEGCDGADWHNADILTDAPLLATRTYTHTQEGCKAQEHHTARYYGATCRRWARERYYIASVV